MSCKGIGTHHMKKWALYSEIQNPQSKPQCFFDRFTHFPEVATIFLWIFLFAIREQHISKHLVYN